MVIGAASPSALWSGVLAAVRPKPLLQPGAVDTTIRKRVFNIKRDLDKYTRDSLRNILSYFAQLSSYYLLVCVNWVRKCSISSIKEVYRGL